MKSLNFESIILNSIKELPKDSLIEIIEFINLYKKRSKKRLKGTTDKEESISEYEIKHLEKEFKNYKKIFPVE